MTRRLAVLAAVAVAVIVVLRVAVAEPFSIPSQSMAPTLTAGDHVLVDKLGTPHRGQLAVFHAPRQSGEIMLKRIVAVSGDTVALEDGRLVVNGRRPVEPYTDPDAIDSVYFGPVTVPRGAVFVLGDNRGDSEDSREFGAVPTRDVIGRARARMWPPSRWGGLR